MLLRLSMICALSSALHFCGPCREPAGPPQPLDRRKMLGCGCALCFGLPGSANALVATRPPPPELTNLYDVARDARRDASFAYGMSTGMGQYEAAVAPTKTRLFKTLLDWLPAREALVVRCLLIAYALTPARLLLNSLLIRRAAPLQVELGIGSFPNAAFYTAGPPDAGPQKLDILGIDPNDASE